MAKMYSCETCGETLMADRETSLIEKVQNHADDEHNMEVDAEDIRGEIEDT